MDIERLIKVEENKNDKGEISYTAYSPKIMKNIVGNGKTQKEAAAAAECGESERDNPLFREVTEGR